LGPLIDLTADDIKDVNTLIVHLMDSPVALIPQPVISFPLVANAFAQ